MLAKEKERDASCADVPATQRKTASSIKGKGQSKGKTKSTTDKSSPAKFEGECRHCNAVDGTPTTATVDAVEDTEEIDEAGICGDLDFTPLKHGF